MHGRGCRRYTLLLIFMCTYHECSFCSGTCTHAMNHEYCCPKWLPVVNTRIRPQPPAIFNNYYKCMPHSTITIRHDHCIVSVKLCLFERYESRGVCSSNIRSPMLHWLVGDCKLPQIVSHHLWLCVCVCVILIQNSLFVKAKFIVSVCTWLTYWGYRACAVYFKDSTVRTDNRTRHCSNLEKTSNK